MLECSTAFVDGQECVKVLSTLLLMHVPLRVLNLKSENQRLVWC